MVDILQTSTTGLLALQRALATTSNNVANAATPGFTRQQTLFSSTPAEAVGDSFVGTGVQVSEIRRVYDQFLVEEVRSGTAAEARLDTFAELSGRVGDLLGSEATGLSTGLQGLFDQVQRLANDPSSTPVRQTVLSEAGSLARRFRTLDTRLENLGAEIAQRTGASVDRINRLATALADINDRIASSPGAADGNFPSDLLDQRDRLLRDLAGEVDVRAVDADNGQVNVFVGSGQTLVLGSDANALSADGGPFGPTQLQVSLQGVDVTEQLSGGNLGGLLDARREVLDPVRNDLGRSAVVLAEQFNRIHSEGLDLQGNFGADFFAAGGPEVLAAGDNAGGASLDVTIADTAALTGDDYQLSYDGTNYALTNISTGEAVALSGSGTAGDPFTADGLAIEVSGSPAAGDRFRILPTRGGASGFEVLLDDPAQIAAAFPIRTGESLANVGDGQISEGEILDAGNPNLLDPVSITFTDPNTYQVNGAGSFTYTPGADIDINGFRVQITGSPAAGDEFTVEGNAGGAGDNRNAQRLLDLRDTGVLDGGQRSLLAEADRVLAEVGGATGAAQAGLESQTSLLRSSERALQSVSGVNLEEEAANLIRFQQAFEANARIIQTANTTFQSLLAATR